VFWEREERSTFWDQKVKGHGGITQYLDKCLTDSHQIYANDAPRNRDKHVKFRGQTVKLEGLTV